ncbi:MAG TPA: hypothetical protein VF414_04270 [Thermoanaerobaculia bacterium]
MRRRALYASAALLAIAVGACCSIPTYTPAFWNSSFQIQGNNNCYNYSNNKRTDTFAQPGRAAGAQWTALECNNVRTAAVADGLVAVAGPNNCPKKECTLALVVDPGWDYHWYRRDTNGMWTHKPGGTPATNLDNSGNPIPNPETADRGGYTDFCGYMCSCSRSTEGNGRENIN